MQIMSLYQRIACASEKSQICESVFYKTGKVLAKILRNISMPFIRTFTLTFQKLHIQSMVVAKLFVCSWLIIYQVSTAIVPLAHTEINLFEKEECESSQKIDVNLHVLLPFLKLPVHLTGFLSLLIPQPITTTA